MKEIEVHGGISSIIESLESVASDYSDFWFRGQSDYKHKLVPSIFRQGKKYGVTLDEQRMYEEFKRRYPDKASTHRTTYEWLTLMQHYGLPTRLLDWSSNLLIGLYFCCISSKEKDGALYVFDPTALERNHKLDEFLEMQVQEKTRSEFFHRLIYQMDGILDERSMINGVSIGELRRDTFKRMRFTGLGPGSEGNENFESLILRSELPNTLDIHGTKIKYADQNITRAFSKIVPFKAPHLNPRIRQQHGFFTFHGGMFFKGEEFIPVSDMESDLYTGDRLLKIKIFKDAKTRLLRELEYAGVRKATIYPEMEYQAEEIKTIFSSNW